MSCRVHYSTTLCQTFSPCGKYLLAGNNYGNIAVFDVPKILNLGDVSTTDSRKPTYHFNANKGLQACSLVTTEKYLLIGTVGEISGYDWSSITGTPGRHSKLSWAIQIPSSKDDLLKPDVNSMLYDESEGKIYAGCGDHKVHICSIEDGKPIRTLEGHRDYIHSIHKVGNQLVSGSEDGTVMMWDVRREACTNKIVPGSDNRLNRPDLGKWIGAVALTEDWLLCGGGPRLALWNLRSMDLVTDFSLDDKGIHVAMFYDDHIMAGGACPSFYHLGYNGDVYSKIPSSSTSVFTAVFQESPYRGHSAACLSLLVQTEVWHPFLDVSPELHLAWSRVRVTSFSLKSPTSIEPRLLSEKGVTRTRDHARCNSGETSRNGCQTSVCTSKLKQAAECPYKQQYHNLRPRILKKQHTYI